MAITCIANGGQIQSVKKSQGHLTFFDRELISYYYSSC